MAVLTACALCGCSHGPAPATEQAKLSEPKVFDLKEITPEQGQAFLTQLSLGTATIVPGRNALSMTGAASDLYRAGIVLDLVDTRDEFVVEALVAVCDARTIPTNLQIAEGLGSIAIGTFANPPEVDERMRAIIDIHGESVVAILPARIHRELIAFVRLGPEGLRQVRGEDRPTGMATASAGDSATTPQTPPPGAKPADTLPNLSHKTVSASPEPNTTEVASSTSAPAPLPKAAELPPKQETVIAEELPATHDVQLMQEPEEPISFAPAIKASKSTNAKVVYEPMLPDNANDVLQLDLPDRLEMIQLLDLVAEYLRLDYMYEPEKIRGQAVSLRLHGKLQGEIRVKDLYPLLESVLKFKGFAMTCHKGNLVTIVPMTCSAGSMRLTACCSRTYVIPIQHPA